MSEVLVCLFSDLCNEPVFFWTCSESGNRVRRSSTIKGKRLHPLSVISLDDNSWSELFVTVQASEFCCSLFLWQKKFQHKCWFIEVTAPFFCWSLFIAEMFSDGHKEGRRVHATLSVPRQHLFYFVALINWYKLNCMNPFWDLHSLIISSTQQLTTTGQGHCIPSRSFIW